MSNDQKLAIAVKTAIEAGEIIREQYKKSSLGKSFKKDDSPLTIADTLSHEHITSCLKTINLPILSEEGDHHDFDLRKNWKSYWLIDPLDGTKEFLKRNDEFTVNIALIRNQIPLIGVVYVPVTGELFFAQHDLGSFKIESIFDYSEFASANKIDLRKASSPREYTLAISRSHLNQETLEFIQKIEKEKGKILIKKFGSSLKICKVAEGTVSAYPRLGPTMEWDTAAADAVVRYSGRKVIRFSDDKPLYYNKKSLLNPHFLVC